MTRWRFWTAMPHASWPHVAAVLQPTDADIARGAQWPFPGHRVVRIKDPAVPYFVDVEVYRDDEEGPVVTGIAVRTGAPLDPEAQGVDWREGGTFDAVSPRDFRRMALATYVDVAIAVVEGRMTTDADLRRVLTPRGEPGDAVFYEDLAELHRQLSARGEDPVPRIAERMSVRLGEDVPENRVHQWLYRARDLGFLERPEAGGTTKRKAAKTNRKGTTPKPRTTKRRS